MPFVTRLVAALSWRTLSWLGATLGFVAGSLLRIRRRIVEDAMRRAGIEARARTARLLFRDLGISVLELLWFAGARPSARERALSARVRLDAEAEHALRRALEGGPVVLAATHTGSWELAAFAAARHLSPDNRRLAVVVKPITSFAIDRFMTRLREEHGLRLLSPRGALASARDALSRGDVVAMPVDQVPDRVTHAERLCFLGAPAWVDRAPATVAARARATLLVTAAERTAVGQRVRVLAVVPPPTHGESRRAWVVRATRTATAALERFVRESPSSWLWLHRRWRDPRNAL